MLELGDATALNRRWNALSSMAALTISEAEFLAKSGPAAPPRGCERNYERYFYRAKGILVIGNVEHAVYVKDISRMGVGIVSPIQLFPRQEVALALANNQNYSLSIVRCRREAPGSYDCGAIFELHRWRSTCAPDR